MDVLILEISSAILFLTVLFRVAFIPTPKQIKSPQKNPARAHLMIDFLQVCIIQFLVLMLSVTQRTTGLGSSMMSSLSQMAVITAQQFIIIFDIFQAIDQNEGLILVVFQIK